MKYFTWEPKNWLRGLRDRAPASLTQQGKESSALQQARAHFHFAVSPNRRLGSIAEVLGQFSVRQSYGNFTRLILDWRGVFFWSICTKSPVRAVTHLFVNRGGYSTQPASNSLTTFWDINNTRRILYFKTNRRAVFPAASPAQDLCLEK